MYDACILQYTEMMRDGRTREIHSFCQTLYAESPIFTYDEEYLLSDGTPKGIEYWKTLLEIAFRVHAPPILYPRSRCAG